MSDKPVISLGGNMKMFEMSISHFHKAPSLVLPGAHRPNTLALESTLKTGEFPKYFGEFYNPIYQGIHGFMKAYIAVRCAYI